MQVNLKEINTENLAFFRYKKLNSRYLLTNEVGGFIFLNKDDFKGFTEGNLNKKSNVYSSLTNKNFIQNRLNKFELIECYRSRNSFLWQGPSLHIIVVTLRCNHRCIYCQTSARPLLTQGYDMDIVTAKKVVDIIFDSPSKKIAIELQGGEPLANWETVKFICNYALKKNKLYGKNLLITMVSNLSLLTEAQLKFLLDKNISICTSLDGPKELHDRNRKLANGRSSYQVTIQKIKMIRKRSGKSNCLNALVTLSRSSLSYPKAIIDEYIERGFREIHLRPISNLGMSRVNKDILRYDTDAFAQFYKKALDYLFKLNSEGKTSMCERTARIFLTKIFLKNDPNYLDLRSPCGAGTGQIVYNYDGKVYTCDEARMLEQDTFLVGDVSRHGYKDIINSANIPAVCFASSLESTFCDYCAYKPYCGVCPVINYAESGNLFGQLPNSRLCKINSSILDYLFEKIEREDHKDIFSGWLSPAALS